MAMFLLLELLGRIRSIHLEDFCFPKPFLEDKLKKKGLTGSVCDESIHILVKFHPGIEDKRETSDPKEQAAPIIEGAASRSGLRPRRARRSAHMPQGQNFESWAKTRTGAAHRSPHSMARRRFEGWGWGGNAPRGVTAEGGLGTGSSHVL